MYLLFLSSQTPQRPASVAPSGAVPLHPQFPIRSEDTPLLKLMEPGGVPCGCQGSRPGKEVPLCLLVLLSHGFPTHLNNPSQHVTFKTMEFWGTHI